MHLNGLEVERIQKPNLLITDGLNMSYQQDKRTKRKDRFIQRICSTTDRVSNIDYFIKSTEANGGCSNVTPKTVFDCEIRVLRVKLLQPPYASAIKNHIYLV